MYTAVIDIGTNSLRLFVGKKQGNKVETITQELLITRLGQGVDKEKNLDPKAIERTIAALHIFSEKLKGYSLSRLHVLATSAVRDSANRALFLKRVKEETSFEIEVLTGEEEARLSFLGALSALEDIPTELIRVIDIGGGSTEVILGTKTGTIRSLVSAQVGAVRMTEAFIRKHPPSEEERTTMENGIRERLKAMLEKNEEEVVHVAVGGTATTLAAIHLGLATYFPEAIQNTVLHVEQLQRIYQCLLQMDLPSRLCVRGLKAGREDVIVAGAQILLCLLDLLGATTVRVIDSDLLQGRILFGESS